MRWTSLAAVVRMLMPPWSGKSAQVVLDQEPSSLPHQENLRYRVLRNESDETRSEAEALRAHFFRSNIIPSNARHSRPKQP
jgi:hypothetical protein